MRCKPMADGGVEAEFAGSPLHEGYPGWLHGGLIAALLDGAMTQCLFAHGHEAVTAEITVRYRHPVATADSLLVRAWLSRQRAALYCLRAELRQGGRVNAAAEGKFVARPGR